MRSGASTRKSGTNRRLRGSHDAPVPGWPWRSTTGGPVPRSVEASTSMLTVPVRRAVAGIHREHRLEGRPLAHGGVDGGLTSEGAGQAGHDEQAQPRPAIPAVGVSPVEAVEHVAGLLGGEP